MKKPLAALLLCCMFFLAAGQAGALRIGLMIYNGADAFMQDVCDKILAAAGEDIEIVYLDSHNSQITQNGQVEQLLAAGVDALILNTVDRTVAIYLIRMIQPTGVPVVFINREPLYEDLILYDKAYYVGHNPKVSGTLGGQLIADYFTQHPEADRSDDGVIQYVMLKGEPGHQDAELRTQYSIKALEDAGFRLEKLAEDTAMWDRALAQDKMSGYLSTYDGRIECVIANNDEMALGAIDALKAAGYFTRGRFLPVVGVDATVYAVAALEEGTLLGTVYNDAVGQAEAALLLATLLGRGDVIDETTFPYEIDQGKYIWTDSYPVTLSSLGQ